MSVLRIFRMRKSFLPAAVHIGRRFNLWAFKKHIRLCQRIQLYLGMLLVCFANISDTYDKVKTSFFNEFFLFLIERFEYGSKNTHTFKLWKKRTKKKKNTNALVSQVQIISKFSYATFCRLDRIIIFTSVCSEFTKLRIHYAHLRIVEIPKQGSRRFDKVRS